MTKIGDKIEGKNKEEMGLTLTDRKTEHPTKKGLKIPIYENKITQTEYVVLEGGSVYPYYSIEIEPETKEPEVMTYNETKNLPQTTSLLPSIQMGIVGLAVSPAEAKKAWNDYQELTKVILDESDYQIIGSKKFKKKSARRKYARFFNLTDEIIQKTITKDSKGEVVEAEFLVRVTASNGRTTVGYGECSITEHRFSHPNHDIPSTAHTRAKSRAISDIIGSGEVSAEEVSGDNDEK